MSGVGKNVGDTVGGPVGPAVGKTTGTTLSERASAAEHADLWLSGNVGKTASAATTGLGKTVSPDVLRPKRPKAEACD